MEKRSWRGGVGEEELGEREKRNKKKLGKKSWKEGEGEELEKGERGRVRKERRSTFTNRLRVFSSSSFLDLVSTSICISYEM